MAPKAKKAAEETLTLVDLRPAKGATKNKLRVGRGRASGAGKTCNRGHNGEGQRSGRSTKRGFEGGQMPGYRKLPKIDGFRRVKVKTWLEVNVGQLEEFLLPGESELTYDKLAERGHLGHGIFGLRILGNGEITRKVTLQAHHVTPGARKKLEAAGCTINLVEAASNN